MLSVILTIYNYEQFVTEAINSVLAQDFPDFEIIAVDDGSQDNSLEIPNTKEESYYVRLLKRILHTSL
jgi:alpha-1,6-rhamnosyltransferase